MSPQHKLATKDVITPADLHNVEELPTRRPPGCGVLWQISWKQAGYKFNVVAETPTCMPLLSMVSAGVGIGKGLVNGNHKISSGIDRQGLVVAVLNHNVALKRSAFASSGVADGVTL